MTFKDRSNCDGCPLEGTAIPFGMKGQKESARFMIVADSMMDRRHSSRAPYFSADAAEVFCEAMRSERFDPYDFAFVPQVRCPHNPEHLTPKEQREVQSHCRQYLLEDIKELKPKVVLPMGASAAKQVIGRAVKITKVAGIVEYSAEIKAHILPTLSPAMVAMYPQHEPVFRTQCATLGRLVDFDYDIDKSSRAATGKYELVDDLQFLIDADPELIAYDTEGSGLTTEGSDTLRWYAPDAKLLTMQFCIEEGTAFMLSWDKKEDRKSQRQKSRLRKQFIKLMCDPRRFVIGQNPKYDALVTERFVRVRYPISGDTLMMATCLDENAYTKGLDVLVKRHVPAMAGYADRFNHEVDKSRMDDYPLDQNFIDYGCGDVDSLYRLWHVLNKELEQDDQLMAHYANVSLPSINAFVGIEPRGMLIDDTKIEDFEQLMTERVNTAYASLLKQVPRSIKRKHVEKGLKFSRAEFVLDILFRHPDGFRLKPKVHTKKTAKLQDLTRRIPSVSTKDHLPFFFEECPFTAELAQYIKDSRLLGTNVIGFKNKYIVDGKVRPNYRLHIAVTGRSSSDDPNGQNYPKRGEMAKAYRSLFVAPDGYYYIEADESQAELRIAGDMANDATIIEIYRTGGDIHAATACIVMGIDMAEFLQLSEEERYLARFKAKAVNFGFLYGMGWKKFIVYAKTQYGVTFTETEAMRIRDAFFDTYYNLSRWHREVRAYARQHQQVRSYSGRIRHLPMIMSPVEWVRNEAERQAINSPVQGFASDLGLMSMAAIEEEIDPEYLAIVSFVHDANYALVPKEYLEWGALVMQNYMQSNPIKEAFGIDMKVPLTADVSFGTNLGEMHELKGLSTRPRTVRARAAYEPFDWDQFWDDEKQEGIIVPPQLTPDNDGRRRVSVYTQCE